MHLMLVLFVAVMWSNQVTHSDSFKHLISQSSAPPPPKGISTSKKQWTSYMTYDTYYNMIMIRSTFINLY